MKNGNEILGGRSPLSIADTAMGIVEIRKMINQLSKDINI